MHQLTPHIKLAKMTGKGVLNISCFGSYPSGAFKTHKKFGCKIILTLSLHRLFLVAENSALSEQGPTVSLNDNLKT